MKMRKGVKEILLAVAAEVCSLLIARYAGKFLTAGIQNDFLKNLAGQAVFAAAALAFVFILKKTNIFHSDPGKLKSGWLSAGLMIAMILFYGFMCTSLLTSGTTVVTPAEFMYFVGHMFLIGLTEEVLFRGLIQNAFHTFFGEDTVPHVCMGVIAAGVMFGLAHMTNAFAPGVTFLAALNQSLMVAFQGVYLCSIYYRTGKNLWYLIFLHGVYDMVVSIFSGRLEGAEMTGVVNSAQGVNLQTLLIFFVIYGAAFLWVMRPKKVTPLLDPEKKPQ